MDKYCIPNSYKCRLNNKHCDKTVKVETWYQHEVYISVSNFMRKHKLKKLIDIGTGSGVKLMK